MVSLVQSQWRVMRTSPTLLGALGLLIGLLIWTALTHLGGHFITQQLRPVPSFQALFTLLQSPIFYEYVFASLQRVAVGLGGALLIGIPLGLIMGFSPLAQQLFTPLFQFLRMISPLSWMPIAVMSFGIGDAPIYFLLIFAAVWPILLNTAHGVQQMNPQWRQLSRSLSATPLEYLRHVVFPAIRVDILTGCRLAIGVLWIVLVPCEMLGVDAGLGYLVLDTRDRMAYSELMATILSIGFLGYLLDSSCRFLSKKARTK